MRAGGQTVWSHLAPPASHQGHFCGEPGGAGQGMAPRSGPREAKSSRLRRKGWDKCLLVANPSRVLEAAQTQEVWADPQSLDRERG